MFCLYHSFYSLDTFFAKELASMKFRFNNVKVGFFAVGYVKYKYEKKCSHKKLNKHYKPAKWKLFGDDITLDPGSNEKKMLL